MLQEKAMEVHVPVNGPKESETNQIINQHYADATKSVLCRKDCPNGYIFAPNWTYGHTTHFKVI